MDPAKIALDPVRIRIQFLPRIRPDPDPAPSLLSRVSISNPDYNVSYVNIILYYPSNQSLLL